MLYIFGGLPAAGKSTLSLRLAQYLRVMHLRIDTIEQAMRDAGTALHGPEGYRVGYAIAGDNLHLGLSIVADSVNPLKITRDAWRDVAVSAGVPYVEIEVICSDRDEHRRRVESRRVNIANLRLPTWEQVVNREYEAWDRAHVVIDTAGANIDQSFAALLRDLQ
jgi:predicted kinase